MRSKGKGVKKKTRLALAATNSASSKGNQRCLKVKEETSSELDRGGENPD